VSKHGIIKLQRTRELSATLRQINHTGGYVLLGRRMPYTVRCACFYFTETSQI